MTDEKTKEMYLRKILNAKIYDVAVETPIEKASALSQKLGNTFLLKREDLQHVHSFKIRGAYNKMKNLSKEELSRGVLAASAGNHAQGVAMSALRLGTKATIVMPVTTPEIKISSVRALGANIVLFGDSYSDCVEEAMRLVKEKGFTYIPPYDDPDVIAGQGTVAMEIIRQHSGKIDAVFVPVGGGGFAAGVAVFIKTVCPDIKVIGVEPADSDCMARSIEAGKRIEMERVGLFADGVAVKKPGKITFELCKKYLDGIVRVRTREICSAIKDIFDSTRSVCEPAGALGLAGAKKYAAENKSKNETYVSIVSGANMNFDRIRFVSEETEIGEKREAILVCKIPEKKGSFKTFLSKIGKRNITEFNYRYADSKSAYVFVGVSVKSVDEIAKLVKLLTSSGIDTFDLTDDSFAKYHIRHMVGGHSVGIDNEVVYTFEFPERPGALMDFLNAFSGRWNITLFHYRNHGANHGRVLVGFDVPEKETKDFSKAIKEFGYKATDVSDNPAYRFFLCDRNS